MPMRGFIGNSLRRIGLVFQNLFLARLRSRSTDILKAVGLQLLAEIGAAYLALGLGVEIALVGHFIIHHWHGSIITHGM